MPLSSQSSVRLEFQDRQSVGHLSHPLPCSCARRSQQCVDYGSLTESSPTTLYPSMAPMALEHPGSTKRPSSAAGFDDPVAIKRKREALNHHKFARITNNACSCDKKASEDEVVETLLTRSISLALDAVGFEASHPLALESFRVGVQECMRFSSLECERHIC